MLAGAIGPAAINIAPYRKLSGDEARKLLGNP
jgi:hypothetical protein